MAYQTPLPNGTDIAEEIDGKAHSRALLKDPSGADAMGAVGTSPAANTLLGRLKAIWEAVTSTASADSFRVLSYSANALPQIPKAIFVTKAGSLTVEGADGSTATFDVADQSILPIRPRKITGGTATGIIGLY